MTRRLGSMGVCAALVLVAASIGGCALPNARPPAQPSCADRCAATSCPPGTRCTVDGCAVQCTPETLTRH